MSEKDGYCVTCQKVLLPNQVFEHVKTNENHRVGYVDVLDMTSLEHAKSNGLSEIVIKQIWDKRHAGKGDSVKTYKTEEPKLTIYNYWDFDHLFYVECECGYEAASQPNDPYGKFLDSLVAIHKMTFPGHNANQRKMKKVDYLKLQEEKKKKAQAANANRAEGARQ